MYVQYPGSPYAAAGIRWMKVSSKVLTHIDWGTGQWWWSRIINFSTEENLLSVKALPPPQDSFHLLSVFLSSHPLWSQSQSPYAPHPSLCCLPFTLQILTGSFECPTLPGSCDDVSCSALISEWLLWKPSLNADYMKSLPVRVFF